MCIYSFHVELHKIHNQNSVNENFDVYNYVHGNTYHLLTTDKATMSINSERSCTLWIGTTWLAYCTDLLLDLQI